MKMITLEILDLAKHPEEVGRWKRIKAMAEQLGEELGEICTKLSRSPSYHHRLLGCELVEWANVIGQADDILRPLFHGLRADVSTQVRVGLVKALGAGEALEYVEYAIDASRAREPELRLAAAESLSLMLDTDSSLYSRVRSALLSLSADSEPSVQAWVLQRLAREGEVNIPGLHDLLVQALVSHDADVRDIAVDGICFNRYPECVEVVESALRREIVGRTAVEWAERLGSPQLYEPLAAMQSWWDIDEELLERATASCRSEPKGSPHD